MRSIISNLEQRSELEAWQVSKIRKESNQAYCVAQATETVRCNTTIDYHVLLHRKNKQPETVAESKCSFQVIPGLWQQAITDAIERAGLVSNPAYGFCQPWQLDTTQNPVFDQALAENAGEQVIALAEQVNDIEPGILAGNQLASFEVFLESYHTTLQNNQGLKLEVPSTKIIYDFVLLSKDKRFEINVFGKRRKLEHVDFQNMFANEASLLNDVQQATLPPTGRYPVVMCDEALDTLFDFFISQCDASAKYYEYSSFEKGQPVYPKGKAAREPLTLKTNPGLDGAMGAHFFDGLGFPLKELTLVKEGMVENFTTDGKLSQLLNWPRTTAFSTVEVEAGVTSLDSFFSDGVIELCRFSTFMPSGITGAFSGEIRLGYLHKNGKKIPIRGGSVSGSSQQAFLNCTFSKETTRRENYQGPAAVFFDELTLAGE